MQENSIREEISDLLDGRRKFSVEYEDGRKTELYLKDPSSEDIRASDWEYAKTYNRAMVEGVFTASEMMDLLKKRNIIGPDYEQVGENLQISLAEAVLKMETETDKEKRIVCARNVARVRDEIFQWNQRLQGPLSSTCEQMAQDAKAEYLTSVLVVRESGEKLWSGFDSYKAESDIILQTRCKFEIMLWMEGLDSDALDKTPERLVLKDILDSEIREAQEAAEASDVDTEKPKSEKPKKRSRRSKKSANKPEED